MVDHHLKGLFKLHSGAIWKKEFLKVSERKRVCVCVCISSSSFFLLLSNSLLLCLNYLTRELVLSAQETDVKFPMLCLQCLIYNEM